MQNATPDLAPDLADYGTVEIQGFTPYAQVPQWIARSGKDISLGAKSLYAAIMSYADNQSRLAFPGRQRLADDLGVSVRSVGTYVKELEAFGALIVVRGGRNERTGNYNSNRYTLMFEEPRRIATISPQEAGFPRREEAGFPLTTPKVPTPSSFTSNVPSDKQKPSTSTHSADKRNRPFNLDEPTWAILRQLIQATAKSSKDKQAGGFHSDDAQDTWATLQGALHVILDDRADLDLLDDLMSNGKWTIGPAEAGPYEAGVKLTKLLNTVAAGW